MQAQHIFLRTHKGITSFAAVSVRSHINDAWSTTWSAAAAPLQRIYGEAVELGIRCATGEHERQGGEPHLIEVVSLEETPADTRADAVTCAAAVATWKSLGGAEGDVRIEMDDKGTWGAKILSHPSP